MEQVASVLACKVPTFARPLKICFIADYGSPTAVNWIEHFVQRGDEVHVISTGQCERRDGPVKLYPLAGEAGTAGRGRFRVPDPATFWGKIAQELWRSFMSAYRIWRYSRPVRKLVREIRPDILHALRIPIEGELGLLTGFHPFVVSIWGNDITLHSQKSMLHRVLTRRVLSAADAIMADCHADLVRCAHIDKKENAPRLVAPGGGGVREAIFGKEGARVRTLPRWQMLAGRRVVVNPRGVRTYVRHDTVFRALALVKTEIPEIMLVCVGLKDWGPANGWVERLGLSGNVVLTEVLKQNELASLLRLGEISVSVSDHDGTPNSLLEAMTIGAVPICGDLESTSEWIQSGVNGWLVAPDKPEELADAILKTMRDESFRQTAKQLNQTLIRERATYPMCMQPVEDLYQRIARKH